MQTSGRAANDKRLQGPPALQLLEGVEAHLLDGFTRLAATVTGRPIALLSVLDTERQWVKSAVGVSQDRELSFCAHAIREEGLFEVEEARQDPRFAAHPLVAGAPHVAHYAGVPLVLPDGEALGTLCVMDPRPGRLEAQQRLALTRLAATLVDVLCANHAGAAAARRAEEALRTSEQRLGLALQACGLGLWEHDLRGGKVYLSEGCSVLLQSAGRERVVDASRVAQFLPAHELPRIRAARRELLKGEVPRLSLEHQIRDAGGSLVWLLTEAQVIERDASGRAVKVLGTCKDITARRKADEALRRALEAADQASQAKSEFLATMSHEIRTPLNGVIGLTQLLAGASLPPMESDSVAMIDSCAKSLLSLVDNILDIAKIEAGKLTLECVPTDLQQLVQEVGDVFVVRAAEKGIRFDMRCEPDVPRWIQADPGRLRQILLNLLGNALKFTPEGSFSLRVYTREAEQGLQLCFGVFDTGIGISPQDQARLFVRFSQADTSSRRQHGGTGLGLAISRELAQLMGGEITVASRKDHGSTFTLRIPLQPAQVPATIEKEARTAVPPAARILLVEDNEVNQLVARRMLSRLGYENVSTAVTGREAVDVCSRMAFDIVLMDCQMPVMDGWEATRQLRRQGLRLPIVALTASATSADRDRCLAAGMDDYMTKPIELAILADKMQRWLAGAPARAEVAAAVPARRAFDREAVERLFMGDFALFAEAHGLFVQQTRAALEGLSRDPLDREGLRRIMHRLRGSAATMGACWLAELSVELEQDTTSPDDQLRGRLEEACTAFEAFVTESSGAFGA